MSELNHNIGEMMEGDSLRRFRCLTLFFSRLCSNFVAAKSTSSSPSSSSSSSSVSVLCGSGNPLDRLVGETELVVAGEGRGLALPVCDLAALGAMVGYRVKV